MEFKLLIHPKPYKYETLDNYLERLADANSLPITLLYDKFKLNPRPTLQNLKACSIKTLSKATGLNYRLIKEIVADKDYIRPLSQIFSTVP